MAPPEGDRVVATDLVQLSKTVSHALRHAPWLYELEVDEGGWVPVDDLLQALRQHRAAWRGLKQADLERMVAPSDKARFELEGGSIRARYGHSLPGKLAQTPAVPPAFLYHGTSPRAVPAILKEGLHPMQRQYVHLSVDEDMARQVGARKGGNPVILIVRAAEAHAAGIPFYAGNDFVWLADHVPPPFLDAPDTSQAS